MMGVPEDEIDEVLQNGKANHRMAGFDDEEKRLKQRNAHGFHALPKLPQGNHIFCEFRTLSLPEVEVIHILAFFVRLFVFASLAIVVCTLSYNFNFKYLKVRVVQCGC